MSRFSRRTDRPPQPTPQEEKIIIFLGVTGSGKSSFIRAITNQNDIIVGHGLCSTMETVRSYHTTINSIKFVLVDTPGFNDTFRDDREILKEITDWLASTYQQGRKITGVIYLHPINQPRMEGSALLNLAVMQKLCGSETFEMWFSLFWGGMKRNGSRIVRIENYMQSKDILLQLAEKSKVALHIQVEMVDEKKKLSATAAAQKLDQECTRLHEENQQQKRVMEDRAKAELKSREEQNKRKLVEQLARQKSAYQLQKQLAEDEQRAKLAEIEEKNRLARETGREAEKERQKLKALQEQKEKLAKDQRQIEAARKEKDAKERKRRETIAKNTIASRYRLEFRTQRQIFFEAVSKWTVNAHTFTFEQQTPEFINWCDRCYYRIRFSGYYQCETCVLQICEFCWAQGDRCGDDSQGHKIMSSPRRPQPSSCCTRLKQDDESLVCDRFGCGRVIRGLHYRK